MIRKLFWTNYLALLATIGSFILSVLLLILPGLNVQPGCPYRGDTELKSIERPAPRSGDNAVPRSELPQRLSRESRPDRPPGQTGVPILTQERYPYAWLDTAKTVCLALIVASALGILIIRLRR